MARGKSTASKNVPATRHLRFHLTNHGTPGTETSHFIDLAQCLSMVNRRLYRQGRDYFVKKVTVVSTNTIAAPGGSAGRVSVSTASDSWVTRNAWDRAYKVWNMMNKDASINLAGNISATWADFKVYLSDTMRTATMAIPIDNGNNAVLGDEWSYTQLVTPDGTTGADPFYLHLLGDHVGAAGSRTSVGLVKSYGESRATVSADSPNVPGTASDDPLVNVFDFGTTVDDVIDDLEGDNDNPPYDLASYVGDDLNMPKPIVVQDTAISDGSSTMSGFNAVCGLLELEISSPIAADVYSVLIELAPGKYRGIKAETV